MNKDKYLGYDPKVIDAWFEIANKHSRDTAGMRELIVDVPRKYRRVVASMLTLAKWIKSPDTKGWACPLCALRVECHKCPFEEVFEGEECTYHVRTGIAAQSANRIYINEYRKVFGDK